MTLGVQTLRVEIDEANLHQQWWHNATTGVRGISKQQTRPVSDTARRAESVVAFYNQRGTCE
jgi:hypothetical protein